MMKMMGKMRFLGVAAVVAGALLGGRTAWGLRIRDAVRMKNEVPNELIGMGLVVGLNESGDGDDFLPAMRPLAALLGQFGDPIRMEKELKNAKNVSIVSLSMDIPPQGAHKGDRLDVTVSSIAAKDLRGGHLVIVPMYAPRADVKMILGSASGEIPLEGKDQLKKVVIRQGGTVERDILPEEIDGQFTLVLRQGMQSRELSTAIAEQINEDVDPQTNGKRVAIADDGSSVTVTIPEAERANPTPFIARLLTLPLPTLPEPARVTINMKDKLITFSDEVEVAPTMICQGNLTITIGQPTGRGGASGAAAGPAPFVVIDPHGTGNAKLRDLQNAFNLLKVSPDDRIAIVKGLAKANALKAELIVE